MTPAFVHALLRRMRREYDAGSYTQKKVWRALPAIAGNYLVQEAATWPFDVDDEAERRTLAERFARALENDEI